MLASTAVLAARVSDLVAQANPAPGSATPATRTLRSIARQASVGEGSRTLIVDANGRGARRLERRRRRSASRTRRPTGPSSPRRSAAGRVDVRERHSDTLGEDLLLVTVPVADGGAVVGALRVSAPLGEVESSVRESWLGLVLIGLAVVGAGLVLAWILAGTVARPLERLGAAAGRLGEGDLDARVKPEKPREVETVGRTFNRMADALGQHGLAARLRRQRVAPAAHAADRHEAPPGGDPRPGRRCRRGGREGGGRAGPPERPGGPTCSGSPARRPSSPRRRRVDLGAAAREAVERWAQPARDGGA